MRSEHPISGRNCARRSSFSPVTSSSRISWRIVLRFVGLVILLWDLFFHRRRTSDHNKSLSIALLDHSFRENYFAKRVISRTVALSSDANLLLLRNDAPRPRSRAKRIVALAEVRNILPRLEFFVNSLCAVADSAVFLDDTSDDGTRAGLFELAELLFRSSQKPSRMCIAGIVNKTAPWTRDELRDRSLLLQAGRIVGGTHFVLLDYDEFFSANCTSYSESTYLRNRILSLSPGTGMYVPWVELWRSPYTHRVRPDDVNMNFLSRRQSVIFADAPHVSYTVSNSRARTFRNGTIHALRCPRGVCAKLPKYIGPDTPHPSQFLDKCPVIEARFISVPNALLKAAWYEALGRRSGAPDTATRGKMLHALLPQNSNTEQVRLRAVPREWLPASLKKLDLKGVETWRARELLKWIEESGQETFRGLRALAEIDIDALRVALWRTGNYGRLAHVPRKKRGTLAVLVGFYEPVSEILRAAGAKSVDTEFWKLISSIPNSQMTEEDVERTEALSAGAERLITQTIESSEIGEAYTAAPDDFPTETLTFVAERLDSFDVAFVFVDGKSCAQSKILARAVALAKEPGTHLRVLRMHPAALSSLAGLTWLRGRLLGVRASAADGNSLLGIAEQMRKMRLSGGAQVLPIARLIFSINCGRSGSKYLAGLLGSIGKGVAAFHEPRCPNLMCSGGGAISMQKRTLASSYAQRKAVKIPMIREALAGIPAHGTRAGLDDEENIEGDLENDCTAVTKREGFRDVWEINSGTGCFGGVLKDFVYAETNPNFKSWFYDVVLDSFASAGYEVNVVVLRKYLPALLKSLYETGFFTSRIGYTWMETANSVNARVKAVGEDDSLNAYQNIISYLINAEAVARYIKSSYGNSATFLHVRSEDMYSAKGSLALLKKLGLRPSGKTKIIMGGATDKYGSGRHKIVRSRTTLRECELQVKRYLKLCADKGIDIPSDMEHLRKYPEFQYREE